MNSPARRRHLSTFGGAAAAAVLPALLAGRPRPAWGQTYPAKPIRMIDPFAPSGSSDLLSRLLSQLLPQILGQPFVIDNRPGAGGNIGMEVAAKSPPDGYTLIMGYSGTMAINPALYPNLPFDPVKDFAPISRVASSQLALALHPSVPSWTLAEFVAYAKAQPRPLSYASGGAGTGPHLAAELFKTMTGAPMLHVPYKGSGPALNDLVGGHVQVGFMPVINVVPHVKAGRLRVLGVTGPHRLPAVPDWAPIGEFLPGYEYTSWFGLLAPAGTPPDVVATLNAAVRTAIQQALRTPEIAERFSGAGFELETGTPSEFSAFIVSELRKWGKVVADAGLKLE
ncbi:MAG: Bug family tripartite tricarboxylate transporter substrate binding protein [Lautropia sp.]